MRSAKFLQYSIYDKPVGSKSFSFLQAILILLTLFIWLKLGRLLFRRRFWLELERAALLPKDRESAP